MPPVSLLWPGEDKARSCWTFILIFSTARSFFCIQSKKTSLAARPLCRQRPVTSPHQPHQPHQPSPEWWAQSASSSHLTNFRLCCLGIWFLSRNRRDCLAACGRCTGVAVVWVEILSNEVWRGERFASSVVSVQKEETNGIPSLNAHHKRCRYLFSYWMYLQTKQSFL